MILAEREARLAVEQVQAGERLLVEKLRLEIARLRRQAFGTSSERGRKLEQLELMRGDAQESLIDLKQAELMLDWCADVLDTGSKASNESPMAKVAVSEALKGFHVLPRRWVVERTFAWIFKNRRLVRAYEQITVVANPLITIAAIAASAALLRR